MSGRIGDISSNYFFGVSLLYSLSVLFAVRLVSVPMIGKEYDASFYELIISIFMAVFLGACIFAFCSSLIFYTMWGRFLLFYASLVCFSLMTIFRGVIVFLCRQNRINIILAGISNQDLNETKKIMGNKHFEIVGVIGEGVDFKTVYDVKAKDFVAKIKDAQVNMVVLCDTSKLENEEVKAILQLPLKGIELFSYASFVETFFKKISMDHVALREIASMQIMPSNAFVFVVKRFLDIIGSLIGLCMGHNDMAFY